MTDIAEVRAALKECASELSEWVENYYAPMRSYPNEQRRYKRDIEPVKRARGALAALSRLERSAAPERKRWRHVNSGALVTEIGRGLYASGDSVDDITPIVFYRHDIGGWGSACWARPIKKFEDQFVEVPPAQTEEGKS